MQSQLRLSSRQKMLLEIKTLLERAIAAYPQRIPELNYAVLERLAVAENWHLDRELEFTLHELELFLDAEPETIDRLEYQFSINYYKSLVKHQKRFLRLYRDV
jgi:hypothetical protein